MRYGPWPRRGRLLRPGAGHGHGPRGHGWRSGGRSTDPPPVPGRTRPGQSKTRRTTTERSDLRGVWGHVAPTRSASTEARLARPPCPRWRPDRGGRPAGARSAPRAGRGWQPGRWPARQRPAPRVSLRRSPSPSGGLALTQELCGSTLRALHGGRKDRKGTGGGRAAPLTVARGLPRGEAAQGGSAELPHGAGRSGKAAYL